MLFEETGIIARLCVRTLFSCNSQRRPAPDWKCNDFQYFWRRQHHYKAAIITANNLPPNWKRTEARSWLACYKSPNLEPWEVEDHTPLKMICKPKLTIEAANHGKIMGISVCRKLTCVSSRQHVHVPKITCLLDFHLSMLQCYGWGDAAMSLLDPVR